MIEHLILVKTINLYFQIKLYTNKHRFIIEHLILVKTINLYFQIKLYTNKHRFIIEHLILVKTIIYTSKWNYTLINTDLWLNI